MELAPKAQAVELIRQAEKILILTHVDPDGDAIGSSLALSLTLQKIGKNADVVWTGQIPETMNFLPSFTVAKRSLSASNDLIITVDTRSTGEDLKLGYKKLTDKHQVTIVITPPKGSLLPEDVTITRSLPKYDLIVILDTSAVDRLGAIYKDFSDLLYETPTVAIDHHVTNSYFAKVNWIDLTSTSTAEMLVSLIESLGRNENLFDADIATALLTGLITDTGSFQNMSTTPKSLTVAAQLVAAGARQQEIIERVFKTKALTTLKLWGKALSNIQEEPEAHFVWTAVSEELAASVGATTKETTGLIDELLKSVADIDFALLLSERDGQVHGSLRSVNRSTNVAEMARLFSGGGHEAAAGFELPGKLADEQAGIIEKLRDYQLGRQAHSAPILAELADNLDSSPN